MPDLNSLPPSSPASLNGTNRTMSSSSNSNSDAPVNPINIAATQAQRGETGSPSPRASVSLQAAATVNAGLQHEPSRRPSNSSSVIRNRGSPTSSRRRSQVLMNIQLNDPTIPAPGEMVSDNQPSAHRASEPVPLISHSPLLVAHSPLLMGRDPHHNRTPSLGELHQELEAEQEAQVNRLLGMIRQQQLQLQQLQAQRPQDPSSSTEQAIAESDRSAPGSTHPTPPATTTPNPINILSHTSSHSPHPRSPSYPRSSFDMARADITSRRSRTPSRGASPRLRSTSIGDSAGGGEQYVLSGRDEGAFYQAETQMLTRENQMLRHRIRDLERQLQEMVPASPAVPHVPHEPSLHSHLTHSTSVSGEEGSRRGGLPTVADSGKEE